MRNNVIIGIVCLVVGLILGALSGAGFERRRGDERTTAAVEAESAHTKRFQADASRLQKQVDLMQMHLRVGRVAIEADQQNYGTAGERATSLFDDIALLSERTEDNEKVHAALRQVLTARDEVISGLATAQPASAQRVKQLYLDLFDTAY
ncbi:MAG TPA: hypothetical protein VMT00_08315 [Thermoanaerobaculia bacterium]|nr:hypothetical protein [Thermoanaerobaculia bacterium]